mmetsp:Transcript_17365/g.47905  ORF Transcript_17365/g.47905 Transcript_17365/m.47905 type:complete len:218 (-) Transcript_17365:1118-1771(-)
MREAKLRDWLRVSQVSTSQPGLDPTHPAFGGRQTFGPFSHDWCTRAVTCLAAVLPIQPSRRVPGFHAGPQVSIRDSVRACVCLCVCQVLNPLPPAPGRRRLGFLWEAVRFHHCETRGGADGELRTAGCSNPWRPPSASSASFRWARAAAGTWTRACGTLACAGRHTDGLEKRSACCNEPDGSHCRRRLVCTWHPPRHVAAGMKTLSSSSLWSYLARA